MHPARVTKTAQSSCRHTACNTPRTPGRLLPRVRCILFCACTVAFYASYPPGFAATSQDASASSLLEAPARSWAVDCANNEALVIQHPNSYLRYRLRTVDGKGDQLRDQLETPEGTVSRLIQRDGRPLTPQEDSAERARLQGLAASPSSFARHIRRDEDNRKSGIVLIRMLPDAMLWSYATGQPQLPGHQAGTPELIVLDFKPDPGWSPSTLESEMLTGLAGRVWIDPISRNMVHLEANLVRAINLGWGILAHIYPGGTVTLQQTNTGGQRWIMDHVVEQFAMQALMVKSVKQRFVSDAADFQAVSPMGYQQAIKALLDTPLPAR